MLAFREFTPARPSERQPGFYWVRANTGTGSRWQRAEWDGSIWWLGTFDDAERFWSVGYVDGHIAIEEIGAAVSSWTSDAAPAG